MAMKWEFGGKEPEKTALAWALKMMDLYEARLIKKFGDPEHLVHSDVHVAAKVAAKELAKGEECEVGRFVESE